MSQRIRDHVEHLQEDWQNTKIYLQKNCLKIATILAAFFINHRVENCPEIINVDAWKCC